MQHILLQKIQQQKCFKNPSTVKEIGRLLGMASHYRRHIKDFVHIAGPLTNLTKKQGNTIKIKLCEQHQDAFNTL